MSLKACGFLVLATGMLAGCPMGPAAMRANRTLYNEAIQDTASEQLLLNIVRLKYREPMSFLEINAINTNYKFDVSGNLQAVNPRHDFPRANGTSGGSRTASVNALYAEDPTFSYVPLQGEQFAKRIIGDIDVAALAMLLRGGWHVDVFLRIAVERVGTLTNNPTMPPEPNEASSYERFCRISRLWRGLQKRGDLEISIRSEEQVVAQRIPPDQVSANLFLSAEREGCRLVPRADGSYELRKAGPGAVFVEARYADEKEADEADRLLGLRIRREADPQGRPVARMTLRKATSLAAPTGPTSDVPIQPRSFVDVLFYLAQGVEVPEAHVKAGLVKTYRSEAGKRVDRRESVADLLNIRCSPVPPVRAMVSVFYRDSWFYIDDADIDSKDTFALLGYLYAVQAGEVKGNAPVLTLPVTR